MNKINLFFFTLALALLACGLETNVIPQSAPSAAVTPLLTESSSRWSSPEEPDSGAVFEQVQLAPTKTASLKQCVTAQVAVHLRAEPSAEAVIIGWLMKGTEVTAHRTADGWTFATANAKSGYIKAEYLGECGP